MVGCASIDAHYHNDCDDDNAVVNCDGSYTLEEGVTPHKAPRVLQTLLWISTIAAGTPHQLIFAGAAPVPMSQVPWGGAGSHPERSFWGSKGGMPLYAAMENYAAQMRVILPSISSPFGLPQPNVTVVKKQILLPPTGVSGWAAGGSLTARCAQKRHFCPIFGPFYTRLKTEYFSGQTWATI